MNLKKIFSKITVGKCFAVCTIAVACGILVLARPFIAPEAVYTAAATKKLPIYCVDTGSVKKVAVSFDAAWGAGR